MMVHVSRALAILLAAAPSLRAADAETFFETKVRPVLIDNCLLCHGGKHTKASLRIDGREALLTGGDSGAAIVPGDPGKSLLILAVRQTHDKVVKMPPKGKLPDAVVRDFEKWVRDGAVWPSAGAKPQAVLAHWAFQPLAKPQIPSATEWAQHSIDRFVAAKWREQQLRPVELADRRTLIRRVTFDLIGLPPTPGEIEAFVGDTSANAYEKLIDRLLALPAYGERWGRHWLDVARYADTAGDNADYPIPEIYRYRDYVIDSFNRDKPFDQFVIEQLAGDILAKNETSLEKYAEQVTATGFLALARRYATAPYELWHLSLEDAIDTTGAAFLGLTMRCARCHDHKFDPIVREDYYGMYAIFASSQFPYAGAEELASMQKNRQHFVPLVPPKTSADALRRFAEETAKLKRDIPLMEKEDPLAKRVAELQSRIDPIERAIHAGSLAKALFIDRFEKFARQRADLARQLRDKIENFKTELRIRERRSYPAEIPAAYAVADGKPVPTHIHLKGEPEKPGALVPRSVPRFLANDNQPAFPKESSGRLELAKWIASPKNPLTARVIVNRIWQHHFGIGIVPTPNNFGVRGEPPSHPEMLDYLASDFISGGWSIKKLHKTILLSKTYQLSSRFDEANAARDPGNRWLWRHERRRLDAEAIRDSLLAVSGKLDASRPGPHPFPPIQNWGWTQHNPFKDVYASNHRSVYLMTQRIQKHPFLALFDGPDSNTSTGTRPSSTVPLQALFLLNNPFLREQAEGLAAQLIAAGGDTAKRIQHAHALTWGRSASNDEVAKSLDYLGRYRAALAQSGTAADRVDVEAWTGYARLMLMANEFVYVD